MQMPAGLRLDYTGRLDIFLAGHVISQVAPE